MTWDRGGFTARLRAGVRRRELTTLMREPKFRITASASSIAVASGPVTTAITCRQARRTCVTERGDDDQPEGTYVLV